MARFNLRQFTDAIIVERMEATCLQIVEEKLRRTVKDAIKKKRANVKIVIRNI